MPSCARFSLLALLKVVLCCAGFVVKAFSRVAIEIVTRQREQRRSAMLALTEELICGVRRSEGCDDEMVHAILIAVRKS